MRRFPEPPAAALAALTLAACLVLSSCTSPDSAATSASKTNGRLRGENGVEKVKGADGRREQTKFFGSDWERAKPDLQW